MASDELAPQAELRVRIRPELEQSEQTHKGVRVLVVKDPVTRRYFRFTEAQAAIIALMAEPVDAETLAASVARELGREVSPEAIRAFFRSLEQKLLVDTPEVRETLEALDGKKIGGERRNNLLYWKLASIDPARIFDWLLPRTRWAFRPGFHLVGALTILAGFVILVTNWDRLTASVAGLFNVYGLMLVIPMIFMVITVHEFSHGLTCRHFGGKVHEVGFMLIYFQPAFYCDVSDSWLFPSRRNRMWVTVAGGYAQFIVWGLCAIVWWITAPETFINQAALAVVLYSGIQSLVNFNPLIKLDGYYILSDYLEVPNLRAKALKTVWDWVAGAKRAGVTWKEVRAQFIYGVAAILFSTSLLLYVYTRLAGWATSNYGFAGLIGFAMFSSYTLRKTAAESISGVRAFATRVSMKKFRNLGIASALAAIMIFGHWELKITTDFKVIAPDAQTVYAETDGVVDEILVREGSEVHAGDVIARMRDFDKKQRIDDFEGQLAEKNSELDLLLEGNRKEELDTKRLEILARKEALAGVSRRYQSERKVQEQALESENVELEREEKHLERQKELLLGGIITPENYDRAVSAVKVRKSRIAQTKQTIVVLQEKEAVESAVLQREIDKLNNELKQLEGGSRPKEIERKRNEIARLKSQREGLKTEMARTELVALIDGVVITPQVEKKLNQHLEAGDEICKIVDNRRLKAEMVVPEKEMADVEENNVVWMKPAGFPSLAIQGRVDFISKVANPENGQQMVVVRSDIANDKALLLPGMTGKAQIYCGERRIIELVTRRLQRWIKTEFLPMLP